MTGPWSRRKVNTRGVDFQAAHAGTLARYWTESLGWGEGCAAEGVRYVSRHFY